jgi:hypothetical protein
MGQLGGVCRPQLGQVEDPRLCHLARADEWQFETVTIFDLAKFWSKNVLKFAHLSTFAKK